MVWNWLRCACTAATGMSGAARVSGGAAVAVRVPVIRAPAVRVDRKSTRVRMVDASSRG